MAQENLTQLPATSIATPNAITTERMPKMINATVIAENGNRTNQTGNMLNQSNIVGRGRRVREDDDYLRSELNLDVKRTVALNSRIVEKEQRRIEIEAQGEVVKDFMAGKTRIKINNAYCRDKTPADVERILTSIAIRSQEQLAAQELAKSPR